jgi:AraC family transcriptional regulator
VACHIQIEKISASDFVNFATAGAQYLLHDRKLSVLAHHLCSKTPNLYKSSEYYLNGVCAKARPHGRRELMHAPDPQFTTQTAKGGACREAVRSGIEVRRDGHNVPLLHFHPAISSADMRWSGIVLEQYFTPACLIPRHEHLENFVHVVRSGSCNFQVSTGGKTRKFAANPGTIFVLPRGTVDELIWSGPVLRIAVSIRPDLLLNALEETAAAHNIELIEQWNLTDRNILSLLLAMTTDLEEGSPAGRLYGDSLANALAVYLVKRHASRHYVATTYGGGLPRHRLKRVLDYVGANLRADLSLAELAAVAGMSPHYFAELFRQSTGCTPHQYVLSQRVERAKQCLRSPGISIIDAGLDAGFQNPSHFARTFRRLVGTSPSKYKCDMLA